MTSLNLRSRLLTAIGLIAVLQVVIAFVVVRETRNQLIEQIDDRLTVAASPERGADFDRGEGFSRGGGHREFSSLGTRWGSPERLSDTFEGALRDDGTLLTFFAPNSTGTELSSPSIGLDAATEAAGQPTTVGAVDGGPGYRLVASPVGDGAFFVTAIPLDGVDATIARLTAVVAVTVVAVAVVLALIALWVIRLGIAPIKRMTMTAEAIVAGDLSERIIDADPRTEAGQLGHALNTMLGDIETSFEQRTKAEDKLRQFIADASHELRTPVATIRGYAELYRSGGLEDRDELDDAMRRTDQESQRMSRLIADMLDLAKLDRGRALVTRPIDVAALVGDACADAQATNPERTITADVGPDALMVDGDEDLLRQVLANVVGNAIVHTPPSSTIAVAARPEAGEALVTVADDGDGMTPEDLDRVTERFFRADPSRSRHRGGSGLGLAIAVSAVEAHHGTLHIDSKPGDGTIVTMTLPMVPLPLTTDEHTT